MPKVLVVHKHSRKYSYEVKPIITERSIHKQSDGCHLMKTECTVRQNAAKQLLQKEPDPKLPEDQKKAVATTDVNPPHHKTGQLKGSGLSPDHESSDCTSAHPSPSRDQSCTSNPMQISSLNSISRGVKLQCNESLWLSSSITDDILVGFRQTGLPIQFHIFTPMISYEVKLYIFSNFHF